MIKALVTAAALVMTAPAGAASLPRDITGDWCGQWGWQFPEAPESESFHYWRAPKNVEDCANRGGIRIAQAGIRYYRFGWLGSCKFTSVALVRPRRPEDHMTPVINTGEDGVHYAPPSKKAPSAVYRIRGTCQHTSEPEQGELDIENPG
jgi:hypothetical protein